MRLLGLAFVTMIAFAANSVLNRMAVGGGGIDPWGFAVIRLAAGALVLAVLVGARAYIQGRAFWPGWEGRIGGVFGLLAYIFAFSMAYLELASGVGALILFGLAQITMFSGAVLAKEPVPVQRWLGAGLAFSGLVFLVSPFGAEIRIWPALAMALAGIGWGIYSLAGRRAVDPLAATAANFILALPFALPVLVFATDLSQATAQAIVLAILSGAVTSGLGYAMWYRVVPQIGAARAAVAQLTVPILAALGGVVLLGEALTLRFGLASVIVLGGVALASLAGRR